MREFFNQDFWQGVVILMVGFPPSILIAYMTSHIWDTWRVQPTEEKTKAGRERQMLFALKEAAEKNIFLVTEGQKYLDAGGHPYYDLDLTLLDATASLKWDIIQSVEICKQTDLVRFELAHASRKLDQLVNLFFNPSSRAVNLTIDGMKVSAFHWMDSHLRESLKQQLPRVSGECKKLSEMITPVIESLNKKLTAE